MDNQEKTTAVVLAAGRGMRIQSDLQKLFLRLKDKPLLYYALKAFQDSFIDEIVLVAGAGEEEYCKEKIVERYGFTKVVNIVTGGEERYHSVAKGLEAIDGKGYVFIHDGARPFITEEILERAYDTVREYKACVVGMPVTDTIKIVNEDGFAIRTPNRASLWRIQTPQVFELDLAKQAFGQLLAKERETKEQGIIITDDAMVVETFMKRSVKLVKGSYGNIKITTPEDLRIAEAFLSDSNSKTGNNT